MGIHYHGFCCHQGGLHGWNEPPPHNKKPRALMLHGGSLTSTLGQAIGAGVSLTFPCRELSSAAVDSNQNPVIRLVPS